MINKKSSPHNSMEGDLPLLFNAAKAAETLGISTRSLWTLTQAGTIPHIRLGYRVLYSPQCLHKAVTKNTFIGGDKNGESL